MNNKLYIFAVLLTVLITFPSCSADKGKGILGIEVPVGTGKVSKETPYIISGVYENTPAYSAGIKPGDLIVQIDDFPVSNGMKFDDIFNGYLTGKPGSKVTIYVKRGSGNIVFEVIRAERVN
jgi:C-terminal processing protease CtpA/Prc